MPPVPLRHVVSCGTTAWVGMGISVIDIYVHHYILSLYKIICVQAFSCPLLVHHAQIFGTLINRSLRFCSFGGAHHVAYVEFLLHKA
jgi:hypothetical protein